jgi:NAD(P)H-dependent flavin oxidoreductase YrpB (nitropropane dioxygenase family)
MSGLLERIGVEHSVVQAGMGGGLARHELAAAVSGAGGLGTIGFLDARGLHGELAAARRATDRPIAVNLLLPFARDEHFAAAREADVLVTFWGVPRRRTENVWLHQVGSVEEARAAHAAGADGVIAQGAEAGGHVRGELPAVEVLAAVRAALPDGFEVWSAGGIADAADVRARLAAGADAVVLGTRFLLSEECHAHPEYKRRALAAESTVVTEVFGMGWPARHRVLPNRATRRWGRHMRAVRALNRLTAPLASRAPVSLHARMAAGQRAGLPFFSPSPPLDDAPLGNLLDAGALYAGETVARISEVRPAAELVRELVG